MRTFRLACLPVLLASACLSLDIDLSGLGSAFTTGPWVFFEYQAESSEQYWRVDGERDQIEWLEIQHGLVIPEDGDGTRLLSVLAKEPVVPFLGGTIHLDELDELPGDDPTERLMLEDLRTSFRVEDARVVLDDAGRATLWRTGRFERADEWLRYVERRELERRSARSADRLEPSDVGLGLLVLDVPSLELYDEQLRRGGRPWRLEGSAFVCEAAMTSENAERCLAELSGNQSAASFSDGCLRLRYEPNEDGWIRSSLEQELASTYDPAIVEGLAGAGVRIGSTDEYCELRAAAGLR